MWLIESKEWNRLVYLKLHFRHGKCQRVCSTQHRTNDHPHLWEGFTYNPNLEHPRICHACMKTLTTMWSFYIPCLCCKIDVFLVIFIKCAEDVHDVRVISYPFLLKAPFHLMWFIYVQENGSPPNDMKTQSNIF